MNIDIRNLEPELVRVIDAIKNNDSLRWKNTNIEAAKHCIRLHPCYEQEICRNKDEIRLLKNRLDIILTSLSNLGVNPDINKIDKDFAEAQRRHNKYFHIGG